MEKALEVCGLCHELNFKMGIEARREVIKTLLAEVENLFLLFFLGCSFVF